MFINIYQFFKRKTIYFFLLSTFILYMTLLDSFISGLTNPLIILSLILWILFYIIIKYTKNGKKYFQMIFPFVLLLKTERFNRFFRKLASKGKLFWIWFFNVGIVVAFIAMIFAVYFFINNLFSLISAPT